MGLSGTVRDKCVTAVFFPVAIGIGLVLGAAVAPHADLLLGVFVVVMFAAVYVRRFETRSFFYGFMGWMGYFFASFMGASFATLPTLMVNVVIASAWVLVLSSTVLRTRSDRVMRRTLGAFGPARGPWPRPPPSCSRAATTSDGSAGWPRSWHSAAYSTPTSILYARGFGTAAPSPRPFGSRPGLHHESKPLHGLGIGHTAEGRVRVRVGLFRSLLADVTFLNVASHVKRLVYEIDLTTKKMSGQFEVE